MSSLVNEVEEPTLWTEGEGRWMGTETTEVVLVDSRGSRDGMFLKIYSPVLETRLRGWGGHQPMRIRERSRRGPERESEGFIVPLETKGQHNPGQGKGPLLCSCNQRAEDQGIAMSLTTPDTIRTLQRKLYIKAKQEPAYRFYALYDKITRADLLGHAWRLVRANGGSPGVDGVSFKAIEGGAGVEPFLLELARDLKEKKYRAQPVRRVMIPKANGDFRPLGIPTIRDRSRKWR